MKKLIVTFFAALAATTFYAQTITGSGANGQVTYFTGATTVTGNNNLFTNGSSLGVGTSTLTFKMNVTTSANNDGIRVLQTGASSAALRLDNSYTNGHNWGVLSTSDGNSQGGGRLMFYDYSGSGTKERMTIDGSGNVGIATYTPATRFHVKTTTANDGIRVEQATSGNSIVGLYNTSTGAHNWTVNSTGSGSTQGAGNFMIRDETTAAVNFIIKGSNGYTGIGLTSSYDPTFTPRTRLHINDGSLKFTGTDPVHGAPNIFWGGNLSSAPNGEWALEYSAGMGVGGMNFWRPSGATGGFANNILFLSNDNRVGIKTSNPTADLTVHGKVLIGDPAVVNINTTNTYGLYVQNGIITSKVRVAVVNSVDWADYVFTPGYRLRPLSEVNAFVQTNNHLPGVPSAQQVQENGVDLLQMNITLLEKIEELTLYIIQQDERLKALEAQKGNATTTGN